MSSELPNYPRKIATTDLTRFLDSKTVAAARLITALSMSFALGLGGSLFFAKANAVDLNIKLMQWRVLPSLQPEKMKDTPGFCT